MKRMRSQKKLYVHLRCFGLLLLISGAVYSQSPAASSLNICPQPFPLAKFYIESQPDSPIKIRDLKAELVQNPGDVMSFNRIRVSFYFENRSSKTIKTFIWDNPAPDESEWPSGGINSVELLPGESHRYKNTFHTQKGPPIVFRMTEIVFRDGSRWKASPYNKFRALRTKPVCVVREEWPTPSSKRSMDVESWATPVVSDRVRRAIDAEPLRVSGINVESKLFEIERERLDLIRVCKPDDILRISDDQALDFDVEKYRTFSIKGRVFAYIIHYEFVDEKGQFEIGASSSSVYVDKDGSGLFSLQCSDGNGISKIPDWVKELR